MGRTPRSERAAFAAALQDRCASARAAWPQLEVSTTEFAEYVKERLATAEDPLRRLEDLHGEDLFLAFACLRGDARALRILDERFLAHTPTHVRRHLRARPELIDEVVQRLRERLLVSSRGSSPRLASYAGSGPLGAWLRVAAVRIALDTVRSPLEDAEELPALASACTPELMLLRQQYGPQVQRAINTALRALVPRERTLLRLYYLQGLTLAQIAKSYGVHTATVHRWISSAREQVMSGTRECLSQALPVRASEVDSILRLVQSQFEIDLQSALRSTRGSGQGPGPA